MGEMGEDQGGYRVDVGGVGVGGRRGERNTYVHPRVHV